MTATRAHAALTAQPPVAVVQPRLHTPGGPDWEFDPMPSDPTPSGLRAVCAGVRPQALSMMSRWPPMEDAGLPGDLGWRDLGFSLLIGVALVAAVLALDFLLLPMVYAQLR